MPQSPKFNYIITIHNKEDMIEQVMMCVLMCCRDNSHIYPVLDGCTDRTEDISNRMNNGFQIQTPGVLTIFKLQILQ